MEEKTNTYLSSKLQIDQHESFKVLDPEVVSYQYYDADQHGINQTKWIIDAPGRGYLLDAFALIKYRIRISGTAANDLKQMFGRVGAADLAAATQVTNFSVNAGQGHGSTYREKFALRQNFPISRSIQTATVGINGYQIVEQPALHLDALNRMMMSKEDSKDYATMSAGYFDDGDHSFSCEQLQVVRPSPGITLTAAGLVNNGGMTLRPFTTGYGQLPTAPVSVFQPANTQAGHIGLFDGGDGAGGAGEQATDANFASAEVNFLVDEENSNKGWEKRLSKMAHLAIHQGSNISSDPYIARQAANSILADSITLDVHEPIPVSPFAFYPSEGLSKCIPNVDRLTIQFNWVTNQAQSVIQALLQNAVTQANAGLAANAPRFTVSFQPDLNSDFDGSDLRFRSRLKFRCLPVDS
jgi:hypothetical protein